MLTCQQLTELVTDYVEGKLPLVQRLSFYMHVSMCPHCRAYIRQMKMTKRAVGALPKEPLPDDLRDALMQRFRSWKRPES
jgi:anti-sigma factor RsiW